MVTRIVISDDSAMARMFARQCLEIAGLREAEFVEAGDGREALTKLRESHTDLLVTDLTMPIMDGAELLQHISASPKLHGLPVLVITSSNNPAKERHLREMGASAVLGKPISPANVAKALQGVLPLEPRP
jgi:two-component system, chemotaxis family, chemotaxis protein CheY